MQCTLNSTSVRISGQGKSFSWQCLANAVLKTYSFSLSWSDGWGWYHVHKFQVNYVGKEKLLSSLKKCTSQPASINTLCWAGVTKAHF